MNEKNLIELMNSVTANTPSDPPSGGTGDDVAPDAAVPASETISDATPAPEAASDVPSAPEIRAANYTADEMPDEPEKKPAWSKLILKILATAGAGYLLYFAGNVIFLLLSVLGINMVIALLCALVPPALLIPLIWFKNVNKVIRIWGIAAAAIAIAFGINLGIVLHNEHIRVDTSPNINVHEYLPFDENSKIVTLDEEASLRLEGDLPIVDGAAAVFPVYSAFVNETYPDTTKLFDGVFEYNNTVGGYNRLAEKRTDIFFGAYPSGDQLAYAARNGTSFVFTPIGSEAFVFFVHKDNPIDNLTTEQIQQIYAGEITNWAEVGGKNEPIAAYQRNEGSGSQSMLIRFMDGKELMEPPTEMVNDLMSGIIEQVSDYHSISGSIGFSFRYYVEGIIQNPDIKMLSIDGIAPTVENIKNGSYPVTTPLYAVTYEGNDNENVDKLLEWVLSDEGQEIIEKTGYAGIAK